MSSVTEEDANDAAAQDRVEQRAAEREKLRTSRFDLVTSFLMALMLFIGTLTVMVVIIFITTRWAFPPLAMEPIIENPAGTQNPEGFERDFEPPGAEEVEELMEPTLQDTIEAVTDAVSSVAATLVTTDTTSTATTAGTGAGDSRPPGPEGEGDNIIPRFERWQLNFTARDIGLYARQLDFYKIELGAIGGSIQGVDIANNLSGSPKKYRVVKTEDEKRLYFMWNSPSPLMQFDRQLLGKAGIPLPNRQMLKFIPDPLENQLANIEQAYWESKGYTSVTQIAKTVFESKADGRGYKFVVTSQRYRKPKN